MKIQTKLTISHLAVMIFPMILLAAALGYVFVNRLDALNTYAKDKGIKVVENDVSLILRQNAEVKLQLALRLKEHQFSAYMNNTIQNLGSLAGSKSGGDIITSMASFKSSNASDEARIDVSSESYKTLRDFKGKAFDSFVANNGLADLYAIDDEGYVLFSVTNGPELGVRLAGGPLYEVWKHALDTGKMAFFDVSLYAQADNEPSFFIAAPVSEYGKQRGAIIIRLGLNGINSFMSDRTGLGTSGESYLLGPDLTLRSDSLLSPQEHSVKASLSNPATGKVASMQAKQALEGNSGVMEGTNYLGQQVIAAYCPVSFLDQKWLLIAEVNLEEALANLKAINSQLQKISDNIQSTRDDSVTTLVQATLLVVIAFSVIGCLMTLLLSRALIGPIKVTGKAIEKVSKGELDVRLNVRGNDEVASMQLALNSMVDQLKKNIEEIEHQCVLSERREAETKNARDEAETARLEAQRAKSNGLLTAASRLENVVGQITSVSSSLQKQVQIIVHGAEEQQARVAQAATAMEEMNAVVLEVASNSSASHENARLCQNKAQQGAEVVNGFKDDMYGIRLTSGRIIWQFNGTGATNGRNRPDHQRYSGYCGPDPICWL